MNTTIPKTRRLFDEQVRTLTFKATVLQCVPAGDGYEIALDQTAFFPEGGGQGADHGELSQARVLDVHDRQGVIWHMTDLPLTVGTAIEGRIDAQRRLSMMQQHTGEHILSGLICRLYQCDNVGFHIGTEAVTVDFNTTLTREDIRRVERLANECVWRDQPVRVWIPTPEELNQLVYRSKKAIDGDVRIVSIDGVDTCACCGTHVETTGQVGQIRVLSWMHYKGGMRLSILCGARALTAEQDSLDEEKALCKLLSAPAGELAAAVERLLQERDILKARAESLGQAAFDAAASAETGQIRVVEAPMLQAAQLRHAAGRLGTGAELALVLVPREEGWSFALSGGRDVRPAARELCQRFGGKGGGPADMVQGILAGGVPEEMRALLESLP